MPGVTPQWRRAGATLGGPLPPGPGGGRRRRNGGGLGQPSEAPRSRGQNATIRAAMEEGWGNPRRSWQRRWLLCRWYEPQWRRAGATLGGLDNATTRRGGVLPQWRRAGATLGGGRSSTPSTTRHGRNGGGLGQPSEGLAIYCAADLGFSSTIASGRWSGLVEAAGIRLSRCRILGSIRLSSGSRLR